jgi:arylamine N-acetyltransferase
MDRHLIAAQPSSPLRHGDAGQTPSRGRPAVAAITAFVGRRRGGYCYEQNGLMAYVLSQLGFGVEAFGGRVVGMNTSGTLPAQTHLTLAVTVPGVDGPYLVDVGFGGQTLPSPIRLEAGPVQQTRHAVPAARA